MTLEDALTQVQRHIDTSAHQLARRYAGAPRSWDVDDLRQEGTLAALTALPRFDPAHGATWATFADKRISGAMWNFVRAQQRHQRTGDGRLSRERALGRETRRLSGWRQRAPQRQAEARHDLATCLGPMTACERGILEAHDGHGEPLHAIGARLGVTESRVSQIRTAVLQRLRLPWSPIQGRAA